MTLLENIVVLKCFQKFVGNRNKHSENFSTRRVYFETCDILERLSSSASDLSASTLSSSSTPSQSIVPRHHQTYSNSAFVRSGHKKVDIRVPLYCRIADSGKIHSCFCRYRPLLLSKATGK